VLDAEAWFRPGGGPVGVLEGGEGLLNRPGPQTMNGHLEAALMGPEDQLVDLLLGVVGLPEAFDLAGGMETQLGTAREDRIHEELDGPAPQAIGDVAGVDRAGGRLLRRREEVHPAEHLVQHEGESATGLGQPVHVRRFGRREGVPRDW
jgi:hypothetical protein